jgi:hypothetical protein
LASDTEYRLREIIQEAMKVKKKKKKFEKYAIFDLIVFILYCIVFKFMKHSKRDRLTPADINSALRLRHVEQLFGTNQYIISHDMYIFHFSLYSHLGYSSGDPVRFQRALDSKGLFFLYDDDVKLADVVTAPLPKVPREVVMTAHWLAIEGVQPAVPQNPIAAESDSSAHPCAFGCCCDCCCQQRW